MPRCCRRAAVRSVQGARDSGEHARALASEDAAVAEFLVARLEGDLQAVEWA